MYGDLGNPLTLPHTQVRQLQAFLSARGYPLGRIDGLAGQRTTRALQAFLRDRVDRFIKVDGIWGPQTAEAYAKSVGRIQDDPRAASANRVRLVMHTSARVRSDYYTFEREAMRLAKDYQRHYPYDQVRRLLVRSGREIVQTINACAPGSIVSWDVVSHSNFGGIHISKDLAQPMRSDPRRQQQHLLYRRGGPNPQSDKDAMFMEEELQGLYTSPDVARRVADYYNQNITAGTAYLREVQFDRFASECYVELHGCRTADKGPPADRHFDVFIVKLSDDVPCDATVVGHTGSSSPRGDHGYRHGKVQVFRGGSVAFTGRREELKFPNASTPGEAPDAATGSCEPRDDWQPPPEPPPPRRVPSWVTRTTPIPGDDATGEPPHRPEREDPPPRDATPPSSTPPKRDVPWGTIIGGAAVVGSLLYKHQRERRQQDRDRDRRDHRGDSDRNGQGRSKSFGGLGIGALGRFGRSR